MSEQVDVGVPSGNLALLMRRAEAIEKFPGVKSAQVGQPGLRLEIAIDPLGVKLTDRVLLSWRKPGREADQCVYPFGLEGGTWLHGRGEGRLDRLAPDMTRAALDFTIELPWYMRLIPGMRAALKRQLRKAAKDWLGSISGSAQVTRARPVLTLADVGA
ncbi:MAG TPA: hypothetical protein VND22_07715 [Actinomycetota bacterium]|nr:hypothetical protein [Actinomycetota bacterium]